MLFDEGGEDGVLFDEVVSVVEDGVSLGGVLVEEVAGVALDEAPSVAGVAVEVGLDASDGATPVATAAACDAASPIGLKD
ncbi:MAG: hypothetical protein JOZ19_06780 [Rubrobacter sp.]|nr:hypothetical protein [Rubrobacter sp.]